MKQTKRSGASLFLIELLLGLLVFAVAAAICIRIFAGAYQISAQTTALSHAVTIARNTAEAVRAGHEAPQAGYDAQGMPTDGDAAYRVTLSETPCSDGLAEVQVAVTDAAGNELYRVTAVKGEGEP
ncbi:hypothetical protein [Intestinibacillus massiliensis]|uniref:hypothetical protein n=1 Tax=Intestinibacillus massiliensis TaxID=1871029 RepID=UPI000B34C11C|nr:hypothetical protein [Intestinibacillus massiliensis]